MNATETADSQAILAQVARPLSAADRELCTKMGLSEDDYLKERNRALSAKLPGHVSGLDAAELNVAAQLGLTPQAFAEAKKLAG